MIIILGMDNSGKTTTAKNLTKYRGGEYIQSMGPGSYEEQREWVLTQIVRKGEREAIHDRFTCFEEMVYGPIIRDSSNFNLDSKELKILKHLCKPTIVYARPPREVIFNFGDREQMPGVIERAEHLLARYDELIWKLFCDGWNVLVYDYTTSNVEKLSKLIDDSSAKEAINQFINISR